MYFTSVSTRSRHRKGLFEKAGDGIKTCQDMGILTGLSTYMTKEKIKNGELDRYLELAKRLNVLEVFLFDIIATGELHNQRHRMLSHEDIDLVWKFRQRYNEKPDYPRIVHQTMFTGIAYPCAAEGCPGGVVQLHLQGNGDVTPCDFTPLSFGNIRQRPLKEIWQAMTESDIYSSSSPRCRLSDPKMWDIIEASAKAF